MTTYISGPERPTRRQMLKDMAPVFAVLAVIPTVMALGYGFLRLLQWSTEH
ncbi:MAG: hypothetical protein AB2A00_36055 [Myxococcota bacterium]